MEEAIKELRRCAGTQFDPEVVELFCSTIAPAKYKSIEAEARPDRDKRS